MTDSFSTWLFDQLEREDEVGELAREVEDDDQFPEHGNRAIFEGYFETTDDATQARFARAWEEFETGN